MGSFEEEEENLWQQWEDMKDAQLEEEEEESGYSAADDEYGEDWDDELWEDLVEEESELWVWDEQGTQVKKRKKIRKGVRKRR
jgi:hypothetical protein